MSLMLAACGSNERPPATPKVPQKLVHDDAITKKPTTETTTTPTSEPTLEPKPAIDDVGAAPSNETDTDGLKSAVLAEYRAKVVSWFSARFAIRGKLPFATLKTLFAIVSVTTSTDEKVIGYALLRPSGNALFDQTVSQTMVGIVTAKESLPHAPEPWMIGKAFAIRLSCANPTTCQ